MTAAPEASLPTILAFVRTYEGGSFTVAARGLHVTPASVSRSVARLEAQLGVRLFRRTTRSLKATPEGEAYYARCAEALSILSRAESELSANVGPPRGRVRISVPSTYGLHHLLPRLEGFAEEHPGIVLDVQVGNQVVDFVHEGFDLAIRLGRIDDAGLVARKVGEASLGVFASPAYLARRGRPKTIDALDAHARIPFVLPRSGRVMPWLFAAPNREHVPDGPVRCIDDPQGLVALARSGCGLCQIYHFMVRRELADGSLVEVLARHAGRVRPFSLVYPKAPCSAATRVVINFVLANRLG